jgi:outer membrane protein
MLKVWNTDFRSSLLRYSRGWWFCLGFGLCLMVSVGESYAETMSSALGRAYLTSPELNAQRADTRAVDETLPTALGGYRPTATLTADGGILDQITNTPNIPTFRSTTHPAGGTLTVNQTLFDGFKTWNSVKLAKSQISSSRESLRFSELSVLGNAARAYMNVLRDVAILSLRKNYVHVLEAQVEDTRMRLKLGEVTKTDLRQAEAALEQSRADLATADTNLQASLATYQQLIGVPPKDLAPARDLAILLPHSLDEAYKTAEAEHPLILAARANVDSFASAVETSLSQLYPSAGLSGHVERRWDFQIIPGERYYEGFVGAFVSVPLYEGGVVYSAVRQAKEKLAEARLQLDQQRLSVRQTVAADWAAWKNSHTVIRAALKEVKSAEAALVGIREEARLGQRTTFDILTAQLNLVNARLLVLMAEHDEVLASYAVLASVGELSADTLHLNVAKYNPTDHYDKVKHKWFGLDP